MKITTTHHFYLTFFIVLAVVAGSTSTAAKDLSQKSTLEYSQQYLTTLSSVRTLIRDADVPKAIKLLDKQITKRRLPDSELSNLIYLKGEILLKMGDYRAGTIALERALEITNLPKHNRIEALLKLTQRYFFERRYSKVIRHANSYKDLTDSTKVDMHHAISSYQLGDFESAFDYILSQSKLNNRDFEWDYFLYRIYVANGECENALKSLLRADKLRPDETYFRLASHLNVSTPSTVPLVSSSNNKAQNCVEEKVVNDESKKRKTRRLEKPSIAYPEDARSTGICGYSDLVFDVDEQGKPVNAVVFQGSHPIFDNTSLDSLKASRYQSRSEANSDASFEQLFARYSYQLTQPCN